MTTGMILGKFLPPHRGHQYLFDFARAYVDDLTVVVGTLAREPIPGALRYQWVRELCPTARVVHLTDENPQYPHEHPDFWRIWRESLLRVLPAAPRYVFASEAYGERLAAELGARFLPVDLERGAVPVSGTQIRAAPLAHWEYLPPCVRPYFARRVCVVGPESTGKTTLARRLAEHFQTAWVPEYARAYLMAQGGRVSEPDMEPIARGQMAAEEALARQANRLLVCDTDVRMTALWSQALFGRCAEDLRRWAEQRRYALYLLQDVAGVPFVPDPVRYLPEQREAFFASCEAALQRSGQPYLRLRGSLEERLAAARAAIEPLLKDAPGYDAQE